MTMQEVTPERTPTRHFTRLTGKLARDPYEVYEEYGAVPPFWTDFPEDVDGYWVITRFEDARAAFRDTTAFTAADSIIPHIKIEEPLLPTEADPPFLNKLRGVLLPHMTAEKIDPLEPRMRDVCRELIGAIKDKGSCDAVAEFARVYPITVFVEFFGLPPERREEFRRHAQDYLHSIELRAKAWELIRGIVVEQLLSKRESPQSDLLSAIANARIDGELIDLNVATNLASTVFLGGLDTLPSNIAWSLRFLATHPEHRQQILDNPGVVPDAVEEFLRYFSVANPLRRALRDVEIGGSMIRKGDRVFVLVSNSNRDPLEFDDPDSVRFDREANRHLAFGGGAHRCLGSHLARHELGVALQEWHAQIPHYELADAASVSYSGPILAVESLPLVWSND